MRTYNPRNWAGLLFDIKYSDTLRRLAPLLLGLCVYSAGIAFLGLNVLHLDNQVWFRNAGIVHTLVGVALSLVLVFRTNTAYERWWEGRKLWGSLVNNSRNLAIKLQALLPADAVDERAFFRATIPAYAKVLRDHLALESTRFALESVEHPELQGIDHKKHAPNQIAGLLIARAVKLERQGILSGEQLLFINPELLSFTDICGACERIKNTPIPHSYASFIKKFLAIYVLTLPFGYVHSLHYFVVLVVGLVFFVLGSFELIAEEIEDPFGTDPNDLPMERIAANIDKHVGEVLEA